MQRSFLKITDQFVKPGGFLLYNTCTTTLLENEGVTFYAIDRLGYKLVSAIESLESMFPDRFHHQLKGNIAIVEKLHKKLGYELHSGLSKNDINVESLTDSNQDTDKFPEKIDQHSEDLKKYCRLTEAQAKKVIRTYPSHNTNGYFMALLQKI